MEIRTGGLPAERREGLLGTGIVYVSEISGDQPGDARARFSAYWEADLDGRAVLVEDGGEWATADEAIEWGRKRAPRVLVRLGSEKVVHRSAGDEALVGSDGQPLPRWDTRSS